MNGNGEHLRVGIIGGSGLGDVLRDGMDAQDVQSNDVPTPFGSPSGPILTGRYGETPIAILSRHGDGHLIPPSRVPYRANVYALKALGCTHVIASGATGSLREDIAPSDLVICDQVIDRTDGRPRTFYERAAVHAEFADPFCPVVRGWLLAAADRIDGVRVHRAGTYICMEGPTFSTRAESHLYRSWGADVIGMTVLPEARLAREAEIAYALVALPTDYDCWRARPDGDVAPESLLQEIRANFQRAIESSIALIHAALEDMTMLRETPSPAHDALKLAIWSERSKIDREEVERLRVLWGRYFD